MWQAFGQRLKSPWDPKLCVEFATLLAILLDPMLSPSLSKVTSHGPGSCPCGRQMYNLHPSVCVQSVFYHTQDHAWRCVLVAESNIGSRLVDCSVMENRDMVPSRNKSGRYCFLRRLHESTPHIARTDLSENQSRTSAPVMEMSGNVPHDVPG